MAIEDYDSDDENKPYWYITFPHGKNTTLEVAFKLDHNGNRTNKVVEAKVIDPDMHYMFFPECDGEYKVSVDLVED